jgi:hypothetical protein
MGRFLSVDPEMQYPNPYLYGGCDWINYFDPDGAFNTLGFVTSFAVGIALIVAGVAITVSTAGIGGAAGVMLSTVTASIIGAGISSTIYSITSAVNDDFSWGAWGIQLAMGAVFGMISAGVGAAAPSTMGVCGSMLYDGISGMLVGASDGIVTNGILNVHEGRKFGDYALSNGIIGAVTGGVLGAITGIGTAARNAKAIDRQNKGGQMVLRYSANREKGHSSIGVVNENTIERAHLTGGKGQDARICRDVIPVNAPGVRTINLKDNMHQCLKDAITNADQSHGRYSLIFNNCTSYTIEMSAEAGIYQPLWARSPVTMDIWALLTAHRY